MEAMEAAIEEARKRGRLITIVSGLTLVSIGGILLVLVAFCSMFPENGPCPHLAESRSSLLYAGILCVGLFCCAPCFALTSDEMKEASCRVDLKFAMLFALLQTVGPILSGGHGAWAVREENVALEARALLLSSFGIDLFA
jgi:hypothetical protein